MWESENYKLKVEYYIHQESMLEGQQAKLFVRPKLLINGHKTSLDIIESSTLTFKLLLKGGNIKTNTFKDVKFKDDQDKIFDFMVPKGLRSIEVNLETKVKLVSNDDTVTLNG